VPVAFTAPVVTDAPIWPEAGWWSNFRAPELPVLEDTATKQNLDLAIAAAQVLQAEATDEQAFSALLPTVSANGSFSRSVQTGGSRESNRFGTGLSASYGFDLWGLSQDRLAPGARNIARLALCPGRGGPDHRPERGQ